jgi:hypothetical protein
VGEAEGAVAGAGVGGVAVAVALERLAAAMPAPAVGLHQQPCLGEAEVDLESLDVVVDEGLGEAVVAAEREEALLEL